jgi:hypothetical protein
MPVLFGDTRDDGLVRVWRTLHRIEGKEVDPKKYPDGYEFDAMPEYPAPEKGITHVQLFNPETGEFTYETEERPLTQEELMSDIVETNKQVIEVLGRIEAKLSTR